MIDRIPEDSFTWNRWRAFNLFNELGIGGNYNQIVNVRNILKSYAIGFTNAEVLRCRPKANSYAVMFLKDGVFSWCHFTEREFNEIFKKA